MRNRDKNILALVAPLVFADATLDPFFALDDLFTQPQSVWRGWGGGLEKKRGEEKTRC